MKLQDHIISRTRFLIIVGLGALFATSGVFSIILSQDSYSTLIVGVVFFLIGAAILIFAEKIHGSI